MSQAGRALQVLSLLTLLEVIASVVLMQGAGADEPEVASGHELDVVGQDVVLRLDLDLTGDVQQARTTSQADSHLTSTSSSARRSRRLPRRLEVAALLSSSRLQSPFRTAEVTITTRSITPTS